MIKIFITTPIYYPSGKPHGYAIQETSSQIFARFKRIEGYNVLFLTGTDEHGQKNSKRGKKITKIQKNFVTNYLKHLDHLLKY